MTHAQLPRSSAPGEPLLKRGWLAPLTADLGTLIFVGTTALSVLSLGFVCYDTCPPKSDLADALALRLTWNWQSLLLSVLLLSVAWLLCLARLGRARRVGWLLALLTAPFVGVGLAVAVAFWAADGHLLPTTWAVFGGPWATRHYLALPPLLLGPLAILVAAHGFASRDGRAERVRGG